MQKKKIILCLLLGFLLIITGITVYIVRDYNYKAIESKRVELARKKVSEADVTKSQEDIDEAKKSIDSLNTVEVKEELSLAISDLEISIAKESVQNEFNLLLDAIENNLNEEELNMVIEKINSIEYLDVKESLLERVNTIQSLIEEEKERLELLSYYNRMKEIDAMKVVSTPNENATVLETITGTITAFTPFCSDGCQGYTASGKYVGNGDIYQYDSEYGMVRIVAGDSSYPFGTIVRIKNLNYFGEDIYAIVLDRGGAIGKNKRVLFDLLFASDENANKFGVAYNVECEILRLGY